MNGSTRPNTRNYKSAVRVIGGTVATITLFLFAVQLLGAATTEAAPALRRVLSRVVVSDSSALGLSWLAAYILGNGSVVAALALSLHNAGLVSVSQLLLMVAGSRLGAAAIVVFIGVLDFLQKKRYSLQEGVSMGLLTFVLTHSIYLPVTAIGYLLVPWATEQAQIGGRPPPVGGDVLTVIPALCGRIIELIGPAPAFVLAVGLLFGSLKLFDSLLEGIQTAVLRGYVFRHFKRTWVSFGFGLAITALTTSVAFSLGVIVPIYNREYITRDELIPYVLGANIGTLFDALVVALLLPSPVGATTIVLLLGLATAITTVALIWIQWYSRAIKAVDDRLLEDHRAFTVVVAALILVPVLLLLIPAVIG